MNDDKPVSEQERVDRYLANAFSILAPLPIPQPSSNSQWKRFSRLWKMPLRNIYDVSIGDTAEQRAKEAADTIRLAIEYMDEKELVLYSPLSIEKVAVDIARRKAKKLIGKKEVIW